MFWPGIQNEIDNTGNYSSTDEDSTLRKALGSFFHNYNISFNDLGDSFINGTRDYSNPTSNFKELCELFLWRRWIFPGIKDGIAGWYGAENISKQELRNKWDTSLHTFTKALPDYLLQADDTRSVFWVAGEHKGDIFLQKKIFLGLREEKVLGPIKHPNQNKSTRDKNYCYFVELPNDLDRIVKI